MTQPPQKMNQENSWELARGNRDPQFFAELEEKLDELFPKGKCKERGQALLLNAYANMIHSRLAAPTLPREWEEVWIEIKEEAVQGNPWTQDGHKMITRLHKLEKDVWLSISTIKFDTEREVRERTLKEGIFLIKGPKHCYVQSCARCEEQERAINILNHLLSPKGQTNQ